MTDVRIVTESLGGSKLSQLLQSGTAPANWVATRPASAAEWRERVLQRQREREWDECWRVLEPALAASGVAAERLERVRRERGVVVTTGQQPGLFGGPIYTWSKAVGAMALADAIERETGIATIAIFWAATDDADFAEASNTCVAASGGAERLASELAPATGTPMSLAPLGDLTRQLSRLRAAAGSASDSRALSTVESAYSNAGATVGNAYVAMLRELLAPLGMPVLDASHDAVRKASDRALRDALGRCNEIEKALEVRRTELLGAGFDPQVEDVAGLSLVFVREGSIKRRIAITESRAFADDAAAILTPNVLLRPIVERSILPTVAYLGGPGELAYFAQVSAVADALDLDRPLALPRWSCTLIEPQVDNLLARFAIAPEALSKPDALEGKLARAAMSPRSTSALSDLRTAISALPTALGDDSASLGLSAAIEGSMRALQHRVDRLERRLAAGIKRRDHETLRGVATLRAALYPLGKRQERALNIIPTLSRHGLSLLADMRDAAVPHANRLVRGPTSALDSAATPRGETS